MNDELLNYFKGDEMAASTWLNKYAAEGEITPDDMHKRLAKEFAAVEFDYVKNLSYSNIKKLSDYGAENATLLLKSSKEEIEDSIYKLFKDFKYIIPGGSVMAILGTNKLSSLSNCFVIGSPNDSLSGIFNTCNEQSQLMKYRGGVGFDVSTLRPDKAIVNNSSKFSTGASSFLPLFSLVTNTVAQGGRRGALMLSMHINHPDVETFIESKQDLTKVTGANISVQVTDQFMQAAENNEDFILKWPIEQDLSYFSKEYLDCPYNTLVYLEDHKRSNAIFYIKKVKARELWNKLMHCAWNTAEPGVLFIDRIHNYSPEESYPYFKAIGTNPCGEIPMGKYDSCRLIHLNLTSFVQNPFSKDARIDFELLYRISYEITKLADSLVTLEIQAISKILAKLSLQKERFDVTLWNAIKSSAIAGRRTGVGFTGLADMLAMLEICYDSVGAEAQINAVMHVIMEAQLDCITDLAILRGPFPVFSKQQEEEKDSIFWNFVKANYPAQYKQMQTYGRRNISWSTVKIAAA